MSTVKELVVLQHGKPLVLLISPFGVQWASAVLFERPLERIGGGLQMFWDGQIIDDDKKHILSALAVLKKQVLRKAKRMSKSVEEVVDTSSWSETELKELFETLTVK